MYARDKNGVLLLNGDRCNRIIVDELLLLRMFKWIRIGGAVHLGVKSPWWAKYVESEHMSEYQLWKPSAVEIEIYWKLLEIVIRLAEFDKQVLIARLGTGRMNSYRKCSREFSVSHEMFRQQLQTVISKVQKTFDKVSKIPV